MSKMPPRKQHSLLIARFPYGNVDHPEVTDWLVSTVIQAKQDDRIKHVKHVKINDTPITMTRNRVIKQAVQSDVDFVLFVDNDMRPDLLLPGSRPFFPAAFDFALQHAGPCLIGAPYCGPPPHENVYIFRWASQQSEHPNMDLRLEQFSREEAAVRGGFEEVAALPTGLMLIDMRFVQYLKPPYFRYEYMDAEETEKATTEDVYFTRNCSLAGVKNYVLWDAWAGHFKQKCVGKPHLLTADQVRQEFREALLRGHKNGEQLVMVGAGQPSKKSNWADFAKEVEQKHGSCPTEVR